MDIFLLLYNSNIFNYIIMIIIFNILLLLLFAENARVPIFLAATVYYCSTNDDGVMQFIRFINI